MFIFNGLVTNLTKYYNNSVEGKRGIRLRAGTKVNIYNAIVIGKPQCLTTETVQTETSLVDNESKLQYITLASDIKCKEDLYSSAMFTAVGNHNL